MGTVKRTDVKIDLPDHRTTSTIIGDAGADPLVLIHAIGLDRRMWAGVLERLSSTSFALAYDLRGFGSASDAPATTSVVQLANDLKALLDALDVEKAHIVGLSYGGVVAQEFALQNPTRLKQLTLIATTDEGMPALHERAEEIRKDGAPAQVESTLERWFSKAYLQSDADPVQYARGCLSVVSAHAMGCGWDAMARFSARERLAQINVPTHVIAGEVDVSAPPSSMRSLADRIPRAQFSVIKNAPHMVSLERPDELTAALGAAAD